MDDEKYFDDEQHNVTDHFDGLGLNDTIRIEADHVEYGAAHVYRFFIGELQVGFLQFQQGPRLDPNSIPGVTEAALLAVVADRVRGFQSGPFSCRENALVLTKTEEAIHWTRHRAEERKRRGVLGKAEK